MPNHIKNCIHIEADDKTLNAIKAHWYRAGNGDEEGGIDFNLVVPTPAELDPASEQCVPLKHIYVHQYEHIANIMSGKVKLGEEPFYDQLYLKGETCEHWVSVLNEDEKQDFTRLCQLIEKYGVADWYSFHIQRWGTKWNAYHQYCEPEEGVYEFDTAWSHCYPSIHAMSLRFPQAVFAVKYADEDIGSNTGWYRRQNGTMLDGDFSHLYDLNDDAMDKQWSDFALGVIYGEGYEIEEEDNEG